MTSWLVLTKPEVSYKDGDGDTSFQLKSDSLQHAHAQTTKTYYKHQDSRIKIAQELKTKTFANFDIKFYEMILENDGVASKTTKEKVKSLAHKAKVIREQTSEDSDGEGESDEDVDEKEAEVFNLLTKNFHDEPMWAADRVVAPTPGYAITIPETANRFAIKGMPNYGKFLKELVSNKHKLEQISSAFLSDESSAMIQNKVPPKLGDLRSFLIPCNFSKAFSCNALADLGASINFMPYSLYAKLSLKTLKPTKMSVRLAD
ncbi:reverse transcriptase domain-containing protein [Tanacetum coccineum]